MVAGLLAVAGCEELGQPVPAGSGPPATALAPVTGPPVDVCELVDLTILADQVSAETRAGEHHRRSAPVGLLRAVPG